MQYSPLALQEPNDYASSNNLPLHRIFLIDIQDFHHKYHIDSLLEKYHRVRAPIGHIFGSNHSDRAHILNQNINLLKSAVI